MENHIETTRPFLRHVGLGVLTACMLPAQSAWAPQRGIKPRTSFAFAHDTLRGRLVMHGGYADHHAKLDETWEFDGATWVPRAPATVPGARGGHAAAYDSVRRETVMFGGETKTARVAETWRWDGVDWRLLSPATSPPARDYHAMAYDSARGRIVMFGGRDGSGNGMSDTWEWDGVTWTRRLPAAAPAARYAHALVYDSLRGRVVLFGGIAATIFGDTWEWDGSTWTQRATPNAPSARGGQCMAYDTRRGRTVLFGGLLPLSGPVLFPFAFSSETWEWDGNAWTKATPATVPPARTGAGLAPDPVGGGLVMFGGQIRPVVIGTLHCFTDTWRFGGNDWVQLGHGLDLPSTPSVVECRLALHDTRRGKVVLMNVGRLTPIDTWEWDGWQWTRSTIPGPTAGQGNGAYASAAYDSARGKTVLYVGTATTWEYDGNAWTGIASSPTSQNISSAMAYDAARGTCVLVRGSFSGSYFTDTWEWNGSVWAQRTPATSPPVRYEHALAYDATRQRTVLFGGSGNNGYLADTWEWDGSTWTQSFPAVAPPPRSRQALAYDTVRGRTVLYGGRTTGNYQLLADTWEWDGTTWAPGPQGPPARHAHAMAGDPNGRILVVGGWVVDSIVSSGSSYSVALSDDGDTWLYGAPTDALAQPVGAGCGGTNGTPVLVAGVPFLGNAGFAVDVLGARGSAACVLGVTMTPVAVPLPGGCTFYLGDPVVGVPLVTNAGGFASVTLAVPQVAGLTGAGALGQGFVLDPLGAFAGIAMTGALGVRVGY